MRNAEGPTHPLPLQSTGITAASASDSRGKSLPPNAPDATICTYECRFCEVCPLTRLRNVCPNCGGNFAHRPIRTRAQLAKHPARADAHTVGIDEASHARFFERYCDAPPGER